MSYNKHWISNDEISDIINKHENPEKLKKLYFLSLLLNSAYIQSTYQVDNKWENIVALSSYGKYLTDQYLNKSKKQNAAFINFYLFRRFCYHDLLISIEESDIDSIEMLISEEILNNKIIFPNIFGKDLYDKYNNIYAGQKKESISENEVIELINNIPPGTYQVDNYIVGSNGLLISKEYRCSPIPTSFPLWHCPDPGCRSMHNVIFESDMGELQKDEKNMEILLYRAQGKASDWAHVLSVTFYKSIDKTRELKNKYLDLGILLADCLSESEICNIFERIIKSADGEYIREAVKRSRKNLNINELLSLPSKNKLQLILLLPDKRIIGIIEQCIDDKIIEIPVGQLRRAKHILDLLPMSKQSELSCYGFRQADVEPASEFPNLIIKLYEESKELSNLYWTLRINLDDNLEETLFDYFKSNDPKYIVEQLVVSNQAVCNLIKEKLYIQANPLTNKDTFINRVLWRLGYDPKFRNNDLELLENRIARFHDIILSIEEPNSESIRENIRSIGVNLFVSIEDFLDKILTYNVWFLSSDHYYDTYFVYNHNKARKCVSKLLGKSINVDNIDFVWNDEGNNTLGVLMCYLSSFIKWVKCLESLEKNDFKRSIKELPHYVVNEKSPIPFLYFHKQFWADIDPTMLDQYIKLMDQIYKHLAQSNLANIRNGLDHKRNISDFPKIDSMISCITHLNEAFLQAKNKRVFPDPLWLSKYSKGSNGIEEYSLINSNNLSMVLYGPTNYMSSFSPNLSFLYLIAPIRINSSPNSHWIVNTYLYKKDKVLRLVLRLNSAGER